MCVRKFHMLYILIEQFLNKYFTSYIKKRQTGTYFLWGCMYIKT